MRMPKLDINKVPEQYRALVKPIIASRGPNKGCLRASKPKVPRKVEMPNKDAAFGYSLQHATREAALLGESSYLWRMVAFFISPHHQHSCMPCTASFDMEGTYADRRERCEELDIIANLITEQVRPSQRHGLIRWGRALGKL